MRKWRAYPRLRATPWYISPWIRGVLGIKNADDSIQRRTQRQGINNDPERFTNTGFSGNNLNLACQFHPEEVHVLAGIDRKARIIPDRPTSQECPGSETGDLRFGGNQG